MDLRSSNTRQGGDALLGGCSISSESTNFCSRLMATRALMKFITYIAVPPVMAGATLSAARPADHSRSRM